MARILLYYKSDEALLSTNLDRVERERDYPVQQKKFRRRFMKYPVRKIGFFAGIILM